MQVPKKQHMFVSAIVHMFILIAALIPVDSSKAADLVVDAYVGDTEAPKVEINTLGIFDAFSDEMVFDAQIGNPTSDAAYIPVDCRSSQEELGPGYLACDFSAASVSQEFDAVLGQDWRENFDYEISIISDAGSHTWPLIIHNAKTIKIHQIEAELAKPEYAINVDSTSNALDFSILNATGNPLEASVSVSIDGKQVAELENSSGAQVLLSMKGLTEGTHTVEIAATNEFGEFKREIPLLILKAKVSAISIKTPKVYYPYRDSYLDQLAFSVSFSTNVTYAVPGKGAVVVKDSTGKVLQQWPLTSTAAKTFTFSGLKGGKPYFGKVTVSTSFTPSSLGPISKTSLVDASPKKRVLVTVSKTFSARKTFTACNIGFSYRPCNAEGTDLKLYSSGGGDIMIVGGSIPLPATATSWKLTLENVFTGAGKALFTLMASDDDYTPGSWAFLANIPTKASWTGSVQSQWSSKIAGGYANFTLGSRDVGMFTMSRVTITYKYAVLK